MQIFIVTILVHIKKILSHLMGASSNAEVEINPFILLIQRPQTIPIFCQHIFRWIFLRFRRKPKFFTAFLILFTLVIYLLLPADIGRPEYRRYRQKRGNEWLKSGYYHMSVTASSPLPPDVEERSLQQFKKKGYLYKWNGLIFFIL